MCFPLNSSVNREAQAIDVVQPLHRNRASAILPFSILTLSRRTSPQTGLLTSTVAVASFSSPAFRGF